MKLPLICIHLEAFTCKWRSWISHALQQSALGPQSQGHFSCFARCWPLAHGDRHTKHPVSICRDHDGTYLAGASEGYEQHLHLGRCRAVAGTQCTDDTDLEPEPRPGRLQSLRENAPKTERCGAGQRLRVSAAAMNDDWGECRLLGTDARQPVSRHLCCRCTHMQSRRGRWAERPEGRGHWGSERRRGGLATAPC